MVTDSSLTVGKPQVSLSEKTSTTASTSSEEEEEDEGGEDEASDEHGEFNCPNLLCVSQHLPEVSGILHKVRLCELQMLVDGR